MIEDNLKNCFNQFNQGAEFSSYKELVSGHINDTYLIETTQGTNFVLQRINHNVFKDVSGLMANKTGVSEHLLKKLSYLPEKELRRRVLTFIPVKNSALYYLQDAAGNYWNMMVYISESQTFETVTSEEVAYEGGKLFGNFLNLTSDFEARKLTEVIPNFHNVAFRFTQFEAALKVTSKDRLENSKPLIDFTWLLKDEMHLLQNLKDGGEIKIRVTHNDTKISNALFSKDNKGLCVIDTDTIMPGIVHYDFGDAIRTICNTAAEDEKDLSKVNFNLAYYKAYKRGFLEEMKFDLSPLEIKYLPLSAKTMIFIIALRFLTDYLNGDIYFKTTYPDHNLVRAKNQFKLIESLCEQFEEM